MRACSVEQFLKDTENHTMVVLKDDGEYRHLVFSNNGSSVYKFQLTTWPGYLCISGDMGCSVFSRLRDMFDFFRTDRKYEDLYHWINPGYWAEKVQAGNLTGLTEFNAEDFKQAILAYTRQWLKDHYHQTTKQERRWLMEEIRDEVLSDLDEGNRDVLMSNAIQFTSKVNTRLSFQFQDFWENTFQDFDYHFIWQCYAIAWGINVYDRTKQQETVL
jgi:hypothetical protein